MQPISVAELRSKGIVSPGVLEIHAMTGGIARADAKGKVVAYEHNDQLSVREPGMAVFVRWQAKERLRGLLRDYTKE